MASRAEIQFRQQIASQQQQLSQRLQESQQARQQLEQQRKQLPRVLTPTPRELRTTTRAGIIGRQERAKIITSERQRQEERLSGKEKEIRAFETKVKGAKSQLTLQLEAFEEAKREQTKVAAMGARIKGEAMQSAAKKLGRRSVGEGSSFTEVEVLKLSPRERQLLGFSKSESDIKKQFETVKIKELGLEKLSEMDLKLQKLKQLSMPPVTSLRLTARPPPKIEPPPSHSILAVTPALTFKEKVIESYKKGQAEFPGTGKGVAEAIKTLGVGSTQKIIGVLKNEGIIAPEVKISTILDESLRLPQLTIPERRVEEIIEREKRREAGAIPGITEMIIVKRPPSVEDVGTGILGPKQEAEIRFNDVISRYNQGKILESQANSELKKIENDYVNAETNRQLIAIAGTSLAYGAISIAAPPVGLAIGGLAGIEGMRKRKEIISFFKTNPKAATKAFVASLSGIALSIGGSAAIKKFKVMNADIPEPTVKLISGKARQKFMVEVIEKVEPQFKILIQNKRITGTRRFEVKIPSAKGEIMLKILEYEKNGIKTFVAQEFLNGKPTRAITTGNTIFKGKNGLNKLITRTARFSGKKLNNIQIKQFVEKIKLKRFKQTNFQKVSLTESETKLFSELKLKGVKPILAKKFIKSPLFNKKEIVRRLKVPFTNAEFERALSTGNTKFLLGEQIIKGKITIIKKPSSKKGLIDIRTIERGATLDKIKKPFEIIPPKKIPKARIEAATLAKKLTAPKKPFISQFPKMKPLIQVAKPKLILREPTPSPIGAFASLAKSARARVGKAFTTKKIIIGEAKLGLKFAPPILLGKGIPSYIGGLGGKAPSLPTTFSTFRRPTFETTDEGILSLSRELGIRKPSKFELRAIKTDLGFGVSTLISSVGKLSLMEKQKLRQIGKLSKATKITLKLAPSERLKIGLAEKIIQIQKQIQKQRFKRVTPPIPTTAVPKLIPRPPFTPPPPLIPGLEKFGARVKPIGIPKKQFGYNVFAKQRGKFIRLNKVPLTKEKALDLGSFVADKSLSAAFKINKTKKIAQKPVRKVPIKYFNRNVEKFRSFKIRRKKEIGLTNIFIEKRGKRLDSYSEVKKIQAARFVKGLSTRILKPTKRLIQFKSRRKKK